MENKYNTFTKAGFILGPVLTLILFSVGAILEAITPNFGMIMIFPLIINIPLSIILSLIGFFKTKENESGNKKLALFNIIAIPAIFLIIGVLSY